MSHNDRNGRVALQITVQANDDSDPNEEQKMGITDKEFYKQM